MSIERRLSQTEKAAAPHGVGPRGRIIIFADDREIVKRYDPETKSVTRSSRQSTAAGLLQTRLLAESRPITTCFN
jgi:hypothetical protein